VDLLDSCGGTTCETTGWIFPAATSAALSASSCFGGVPRAQDAQLTQDQVARAHHHVDVAEGGKDDEAAAERQYLHAVPSGQSALWQATGA
jgi:hypothetical protein